MEKLSLKDYRAAHILVNFMRCQAQGWYTREKILAIAGHPGGRPEELETAAAWIDKAAASQKEIEFVNYLVSVFKDETVYGPRTCGDIVPMIKEVMNGSLRVWAGQADKYLRLLGV